MVDKADKKKRRRKMREISTGGLRRYRYLGCFDPRG